MKDLIGRFERHKVLIIIELFVFVVVIFAMIFMSESSSYGDLIDEAEIALSEKHVDVHDKPENLSVVLKTQWDDTIVTGADLPGTLFNWQRVPVAKFVPKIEIPKVEVVVPNVVITAVIPEISGNKFKVAVNKPELNKEQKEAEVSTISLLKEINGTFVEISSKKSDPKTRSYEFIDSSVKPGEKNKYVAKLVSREYDPEKFILIPETGEKVSEQVDVTAKDIWEFEILKIYSVKDDLDGKLHNVVELMVKKFQDGKWHGRIFTHSVSFVFQEVSLNQYRAFSNEIGGVKKLGPNGQVIGTEYEHNGIDYNSGYKLAEIEPSYSVEIDYLVHELKNDDKTGKGEVVATKKKKMITVPMIRVKDKEGVLSGPIYQIPEEEKLECLVPNCTICNPPESSQ